MVVAVLAVAVAEAAGVSRAEIAEVGWLVALQLWFLPVYLLLIALTPVLLAAHRRWGLAVPAVMAAAVALVDAGVAGPHLHVIGYANYLLVWGCIHQWGFAWQDHTLTSPWWRPFALAAGGAALLAGLLVPGWFMVDMVGSGNTNRPSIALLAYAAVQAGLVLAAESAASRLLARPGLWQRVRRLNAAAMTVYLWHFVPVIVIAVAFFPTGVLPQPAVGTAQWWELRPAWLALLTVVLVPLVMVVMRAERPMLRLPAPRAVRALVARAPGARPCRLHGGPGQARDRRIRPRRASAGIGPSRLRPPAWPRPCSPAAPGRGRRTASPPPSAAAAAAQGRLNRIPGVFADRRPVRAVVTAWPDRTLWRLAAGLRAPA